MIPLWQQQVRAATRPWQGRAAAGAALWQGGLSVWPRVVGGERHVQALPHLWCDVVVGSSEPLQKW